MQKNRIDYAKLLGFDLASNELSDGVDFQDERFEARFGAKVGGEVLVALDIAAAQPEVKG